MIDLDAPRDIRTVLGMHTPAARLLVTVYIVAITIITVASRHGVSAMWPSLLALVILSAATVGLLTVPGDPLPRAATAAMTAAGPIACALTLSAVPVPLESSLQGWTHGAATTICCFMCVRGRIFSAWIGLVSVAAAYAAWTTYAGFGPTQGVLWVRLEIGPVGMATLLALTLRPNVRMIFELRDAAARRIATQSAAAAAVDERDAQLARLDNLARPMLERIAAGGELDRAEQQRCGLLEAHLRDLLRAPALADPVITELVQDARSRGVDVVLIDDHAMDDADEEVQRRVRAHVADALCASQSGAVRVRILPPDRRSIASIVIQDGDIASRAEYGHDGNPHADCQPGDLTSASTG